MEQKLSDNLPTNIQKSKFSYPACWQDNDRMGVLFAPFRCRDINPESFNTKINFWKDLILQYCEHKGTVCFSKQNLILEFTRDGAIPQCLDTVIEVMQSKGLIRLRTEYEYDPINSWTGWAIQSFVKKPLSWGILKIKNTVNGKNICEQSLLEYVYIDIVKKFCSIIETEPRIHHGQLLNFSAVKCFLENNITITEECLKLCLWTLHCRRRIGLEYKIEENEKKICFIKIPSSINESINISKVDYAIYSLQLVQVNLQKQLATFELEIKLNDEKLFQYLKENKRPLAKSYLRKKHLLEENHEKCSNALHNIETLIHNLEDTQTSGEIFKAYKIGSDAIQNALNNTGLNFDNVDDIISKVRDSIETSNEIHDDLSKVILVDTIASDDDLELELKQILEDDHSQPKYSFTATGKEPKKINTDISSEKIDIVPIRNTQAKTGITEQMLKNVEYTDTELLTKLNKLKVDASLLNNSSAL